MSIDKNLLNRLSVLYVEDDQTVRDELCVFLTDFFGKVFIAKDGKEGLDLYLENKDSINIILTDINMPNLSGIDMVKKIREHSLNLPIFFTTAHTDIEFLAEAIKLKVQEYITKPVDVRNLLSKINEVANVLYQDFLLEQQTKELEQYKQIIDTNNIVVKTDIYMKITYVNELFCEISGYNKEELLGKKFDFLKHPEFSNDVYTKLYADVLNSKTWHGVLKNSKKDKTEFNIDCFCMPTYDDSGELTGLISIQKDITEELNKKRDIQLALMKDKSNIFIKSKEGNAEQVAVITSLKKQIEVLKNSLQKSEKNSNKYIHSIEKYTIENRALRTQLVSYKKTNEKKLENNEFLKLNEQLKYENKKLKTKAKEDSEKLKKDIKEQKVNYEIKIDDLHKELRDLKEKYETIESDDVLIQKLEYWKEKALSEASRLESLEKKVMSCADEKTMKKIFS